MRAYATFIDASKAFDKINRSILWVALFNKIGFNLTNILMKYYSISKAYILKDGFKSSIFKTTTGVKQGGPVSALLFALYIEDLVAELDKTGIGIKIGNININILLYADDIVLISNTKKEMQIMLELTGNFGNKIELKFNPTKTNYLAINETHKTTNKQILNDLKIQLKLDNKIIDRVDKVTYLGTVISDNLKSKSHILNRIALSFAGVSRLNKETLFDSIQLNPNVKFQQYKTYIRPLLTHGLENLVLYKKEIRQLQSTETGIILRNLNLPPRLRTSLLLMLLKLQKISNKNKAFKSAFFIRLLNNDYTRELIEELLKFNSSSLHNHSLVVEIRDNSEINSIHELFSKCSNQVKLNEEEFKENLKSNKDLIVLKTLFENFNSNKEEITKMLKAF